jgi:sulfate permease, SulP family
VVGGLAVTLSLSLASLVFSGALSEFLPVGARVVLFGAAVVAVVGGISSSFPGTIVVPQSAPAAITAIMAAALAAKMSAGGASASQIGFMVLVALGCTTLLTGLFLLLLGRLKLGALVRFVPYPVFGGFLAGTGWLLVQGAVRVMAGIPLVPAHLPELITPAAMAQWLPGLFFALVLLGILRRFAHLLVMPAVIVFAVALFYLALNVFGISTADAVSRGLLMAPFGEPGRLIDGSAPFFAVDGTHLRILAEAMPAVLVISVVDLLFSASALELAVARDIDLNHELKAAGAANLLAGLGGGIIGYQSMTFSVLSRQIGSGNSRLAGLVSAGICGLTLVFGSTLLHLFPKPILGGLLMFLGLSFLRDWLWDAYSRLSATDYGIVLLILTVIVIGGFMAGLALGMVAAVLLFVVDYSRIDVIKHALSGRVYHSNVDRSGEEHQRLLAHGGQIHIFKLQGFIFFGTASSLLDTFRHRAEDEQAGGLKYALFDFARVTALDSSAVYSFLRMNQLAESQGIQLVFTHLTDQIRQRFTKGGLDENTGAVRFFQDLDRGLEWCENKTLAEASPTTSLEERRLVQRLRTLFSDPALADRFMAYLQKKEIGEGAHLIRQGDPSDELYFLDSGQVTALLETDGGKSIRLRTMQAGTVVGEIGLYLSEPRSASVVADRPATVYLLSVEALCRMRADAPELAAEFHRFISCLLAERLVQANASLKSLQD